MEALIVSPSPHRHSGVTTSTIMRDVLIALIPALIASVIFFGPRALLVTAVCAASAIFFEYAYRRLLHREQTVGDLSAAVTGVLLAFNLPVSIPLWIAVIGSFVAVVIVKQLFGGIGKNFANPAITARIVLMVSFAVHMTNWTDPFSYLHPQVDAFTSATPLSVLAEGEGVIPSTLQLFLGNVGGCLGETSALALLLGGGYLLARRVIRPHIPLAYIGTVALLTLPLGVDKMAIHLFSGGLMIGALFMATDYATSPITNRGKVIFGIGCGLLTVLIRQFGSYPEGVSFSILLMNLLVPYIDRWTAPRPFGMARDKKKKEKKKTTVEGDDTPIRPLKDVLRPTVALCVVVVVIAGALLATYRVTRVEEETGLTESLVAELNGLVPQDAEWTELSPPAATDDAEFTRCFSSDAGTVYEVVTKSYGGDLTLLVGIAADGSVSGVTVTETSDTPGLGSKAADVSFLSQFIGRKETITVAKNKTSRDTDIVAVAGATISSKAVTAAVNAALEADAGMGGEQG